MGIRDDWLNRYHNIKTRNQAGIVLRALDIFIKEKYEQSEQNLLDKCKISEMETGFVLDEIVQFWYSFEYTTVTIRNYLTFVRDYLRRNGIKTDEGTVKDYVKWSKTIEEEKLPLDKKTIKDILYVSNSKYKVFFLCLLSSGMRVGELLLCKTSWLDLEFYKKYGYIVVHIPGEFTKGQRDRWTFFSRQASQLLEPYIKNRINNGELFDISYGSAQEYMAQVRNKLDLKDTYKSGTHKITIHVFRSNTDTALTDFANKDFADYLLGHKLKLKYYRKTPVEGLEFYQKAENELTIELEITTT